MDGFKVSGNINNVCEYLRQVADWNKGKTVREFLIDNRKDKLERACAKQFGITVKEYRECLGK